MIKPLHFHFSLSLIGEGNGTPIQYSCLENPRDRGAWWAAVYGVAVYGVAQSRTRLKQLSSSSSSSGMPFLRASQMVLVIKNPPANAGDVREVGSILGSGRSPGGGHGNPLQYACLENPMNRGVWWSIVHRVKESDTTEGT